MSAQVEGGSPSRCSRPIWKAIETLCVTHDDGVDALQAKEVQEEPRQRRHVADVEVAHVDASLQHRLELLRE